MLDRILGVLTVISSTTDKVDKAVSGCESSTYDIEVMKTILPATRAQPTITYYNLIDSSTITRSRPSGMYGLVDRPGRSIFYSPKGASRLSRRLYVRVSSISAGRLTITIYFGTSVALRTPSNMLDCEVVDRLGLLLRRMRVILLPRDGGVSSHPVLTCPPP